MRQYDLDNLTEVNPNNVKTGTLALKIGNQYFVTEEMIQSSSSSEQIVVSNDYYKCASITQGSSGEVIVSGAGSSEVNGTYTLTDATATGFSRIWTNSDGAYIWWNVSLWSIGNLDQAAYIADDGQQYADPWLADSWSSFYGDQPAPIVAQGSSSPTTWSGYLLTITSTGITYASQITSGLSCGSGTPVIGGIYTDGLTKRIYQETLIPTNIKKDITIFGVTGTYETSGGTANYYKCASVDSTTSTWTGYLYDKTTQSIASTTTNLTYISVVAPIVGCYYNEDGTIKIDIYSQSGLIFYAPLYIKQSYDQIGQSLVQNGTVTHTVQNGIMCASISGFNNYIGKNDIQLNGDLSITAWIKIGTADTAAFISLCYGTYDHGPNGKELWIIKSSTNVAISNGQQSITEFTLSDTGWHFIGFTYGSGTLKLYVNGELKTTTNDLTIDMNGTRYFCINTLYRAIQYVIGNGLYSGVRIYNTILSDQRMSALASEFTPANS